MRRPDHPMDGRVPLFLGRGGSWAILSPRPSGARARRDPAYPRGPMTEILTESFCERCGTRYTFESARPRIRLKGVKVLSRGLRNFVLSDDTSIDEAMAAARSEAEREATRHQLDAFHKTFNFCLSCRQYTCPNCWNGAEARCLSCAPLAMAEAPTAGGGFRVLREAVVEVEPTVADAEGMSPAARETADKAATQTSDLLERFRPGQSLDAELDAYERERSDAGAIFGGAAEPELLGAEPKAPAAIQPEPATAEIAADDPDVIEFAGAEARAALVAEAPASIEPIALKSSLPRSRACPRHRAPPSGAPVPGGGRRPRRCRAAHLANHGSGRDRRRASAPPRRPSSRLRAPLAGQFAAAGRGGRPAAVPRPTRDPGGRHRGALGRLKPGARGGAPRSGSGDQRDSAVRQLRPVTLGYRPVLPALRQHPPGADPADASSVATPAGGPRSRTRTQAAPNSRAWNDRDNQARATKPEASDPASSATPPAEVQKGERLAEDHKHRADEHARYHQRTPAGGPGRQRSVSR